MDEQVVTWIAAFSYPAVFLLLVLCGVGAPLSEELVVISGGVIAARSGANPVLMMAVAWLGILVGDSLLFHLGRTLGPRVLQHPKLRRVLTPRRVHTVQQRFSRLGAGAVLLARFLPGFRAPSFLLSGASAIPYRRFLLADGIGAVFSAGVVTWLGYRFGARILADLRGGLHWVLGGVLVLGAGWLVARWWRRRGGLGVPAPP
ncbi:DedA family protein [Corallococcus sp. M34]|uniref:DedA family protein n=1 Tax=Citreicoccus inhibens TaxID=2849499 RepID=UPI001C232CF2|nr:DedA family protein [Citreicoccus inhibens]MBU8898214.1 DedA family protein [Citreicoccus inhibens]